MAAITVAGRLCAWSLCALLADLGFALAHVEAPVASPRWRAVGIIGCLSAPALAALFATMLPEFGLELAAALLAVCYVPAGFAYFFGRRLWLLWCYGVWSAVQEVASAAVGSGLQLAAGRLLSESDGHIDGRWTWFWWLVTVNFVLCWLSLLLQISVFTLLGRLHRAAVRAIGLESTARMPTVVCTAASAEDSPQIDVQLSHATGLTGKSPLYAASSGGTSLAAGSTEALSRLSLDGDMSDAESGSCRASFDISPAPIGIGVGVEAAGADKRIPPFLLLSAPLGAPAAGSSSAASAAAPSGALPPPLAAALVSIAVPKRLWVWPLQAGRLSTGLGLSCGASVLAGFLCLYSVALIGAAGGSLRYVLGTPPGFVHSLDLPPPTCRGYFCAEHFAAAEIAVATKIPYGEAFNWRQNARQELVMDVYSPNGKNLSAPAPAIVMMHGGAFRFGGRQETLVVEEATYLARHGFVVFNIDYRLEAGLGIPEVGAVRDAVHDVKAAVRYVVKHAARYGVDASRIATWGTSAGAIASGSMDFVPEEGDSGNEGYPSHVGAHVLLSGCLWPFLLSIGGPSPKPPAPWFDVHGTSDTIVFPFLAVATNVYLHLLGSPQADNRLAWVPGGRHEPWARPVQPDKPAPRDVLRPHVVAFLVQALRL